MSRSKPRPSCACSVTQRILMAACMVALGFTAAISGSAKAGAIPLCTPADTPTGCSTSSCPIPSQTCLPRCVRHFPESGFWEVLSCECVRGECHAELPAVPGNRCVLRDEGGTIHLPPAGCSYQNPPATPWQIVDGLPPASTIDSQVTQFGFTCSPAISLCTFPTIGGCYGPGGSLGGEKSCASSSFQMIMSGTGGMTGYNRVIQFPVELEVHAAPRALFNPIQSFDTDLFRMFGQITGDPDFDLLRIVAGTDFGLPSPGKTILTQQPAGHWAVDSFFDVTYRIDFVGSPGGPLAGRSGSTTGTVRMITGSSSYCEGTCPPGFECRESRIINEDGSIDICCECVIPVCEPAPSGLDCNPVACPESGEQCVATCIRHNPETGSSVVLQCDCRDPESCHAEPPDVGSNPCVVPDGGNGTVHLPPAGCAYRNPLADPWQIIDGLPPASTIDSQVNQLNFVCSMANAVCSFPTPPSCYQPGGGLGGEQSCFVSDFQMTMSGTGGMFGFNRFINVPISFEIHTAPRVINAPVQSFATDMFRMFGQITGDPDFDLLRIVAGTDFGLPSPGQTTLTILPGGNWSVDSFFDITYRIDFVGKPGGSLSGRSGSTTGTVRMSTGSPPVCVGICPPGHVCYTHRVINDDGTIDYCCECLIPCACAGDMNGDYQLNALDIQGFVNCYVNFFGSPIPQECICADINQDGVFTAMDVVQFVDRLLASPKTLCPPV